MVQRIIDPQRFILNAAITDWKMASRKHQRAVSADELARNRRISSRVLQLRWLLDPKLGYPTEAFKVWRRPSMPMEGEKPLEPQVFETFLGWTAYVFDRPLTFLKVRFQVNSQTTILAYGGAPFSSAVVDWASLQPGIRMKTFSGAGIACLVVYGDADPQEMTGITGQDAADDGSWELIERVGLPVDSGNWAGVFNLDGPQGFEAALIDPIDAARDRFRRGAPLFGWDDEIEPGKAAPSWSLADPEAILKAFEVDLSKPLQEMVTSFPPNRHTQYVLNETMPINEGANTADTRFIPISMLMLGASSDPLFSLICGFGTAYDDQDIPVINLGNQSLFGDGSRSDWDYMVTAHYDRGIDGESDTIEYAALIRAPKFATPPPKPAHLKAFSEGLTPPDQRDERYRGVVRIAWDKLLDMTPFRIASYALARTGVSPASGIEALMDGRKFDPSVPQPISATTSRDNELATGSLRALDESRAIDPSFDPNILRYAVAHQDLFGFWSGWSTVGHALKEPPVQSARLLSARLDVTAPASGSVCPATLVIDFTWDWAVRSPDRISLVGRLYKANKPGEAPSNLSVPGGLQTAFPGGAGAALVVTFSGDAGTASNGASLAYVSDDGKEVKSSPVLVNGPRRYRLTLPGIALDYASAGHIGIALWSQGKERLLPKRDGAWSVDPKVSSASDPRPPVITMIREDVELASLADGRGEHRVKLDWAALPGAVGYYVYETTESKLRVDLGLGEAAAGLTLSQRLLALRNAFHDHPVRRPFTRVNAEPLTGLETEIVIPRGSKEIHMYLVLGTSAGQVESAWPDLSDANRKKRFRAFAAPQVVPPTPPVLEVSRDLAAMPVYRAKLAIKTRPGAVVTRIDLYRTRVPEASLTVDTMGPPIVSLTGSGGAWIAVPTVSTEPGESQPLGTLKGFDSPDGSWKRVFYRAVAWSGDDPQRAIYGGRSGASPAMHVIVPPSTPPDLAPIISSWPGGPLTNVLLTTSSAAPVDMTELGPHRIRVEAMSVKPDGSIAPLYAYPPIPAIGAPDDTLASVPTVAGSGLWRESIPGGTRYKLALSKAAVEDGLRLRILLTDPLGRSTEQVLEAPGGSPLPAPDILNPVITKVPGKGYVLGFKTHASFKATLSGPYTLQVSFIPSGPFPNSPPGPAIGVTVDLPSIPVLQPLTDPFATPVNIPLRRSKPLGGATPVGIYLRAKGQVSLVLTGPDGQKVVLKKKVQ